MSDSEPTANNEGLSDPSCYPPVSGHVDLCLRMMTRAAFDYKRNRKVSEIIELLSEWFSEDEINQARELAGQGVIPPIADLDFYKDNAESSHRT